MAAASSSGSRRYDVFPSFSGQDVRKTFLSHLLKELDRRSINTFIDHGIERSSRIRPSLSTAIAEARISVVIFSKNYASSTWCLNELVEIHKCYEKGEQMVIPVFYDVDPSEVRKQNGEFGDVFKKTCVDKPEDQKQRWMQALNYIANVAGEDLQNGPDEAHMVEKIANDVSNKLITPSKCFGDFVGIEAHIEAMNLLCLKSKEARMVGIWGQSGIGKSTIGRALFSQLSSQFPLRAFVTYKSTSGDVSGMKLSWEKELLSEILGQKDINIEHFGVVEQRLNHKKVLIVLDDVDNLEFLKTLVGKTEWFGPGSRIIVITQDRQLLKAHDIDLLYEVKLPSQGLALKMISRYAFGKDSPPDDFKELAFEVAKLAGNLPLGLSVLGSSLRGRSKKEWMEMLPELQSGLEENIGKILRVSYHRLGRKYQELFLSIACLFSGEKVSYIKGLLSDNVNIGLKMLADKSLIRITLNDTIEMHNLLQKLGTEIDRADSMDNPGKRRYLTDFEDIGEVLTDKTGTETVLGIHLETYLLKESLSIDEKSFEGMHNLQYLIVWSNMKLPQGLAYLPRKLRLLQWDYCPLKSLPSNFKGEYLVELNMYHSKLEKLWEGTLQLGSLKKMIMDGSIYLREIPDLSNAINLEKLYLSECKSLVTLPSSIQNATKLRKLDMRGCTMLEKLWEGVQSLGSLEEMDLSECENLTEIPDLSKATNLWSLKLNNCKSLVKIPSTIGNLQKLRRLYMKGCSRLEVLPVDVNLSSLRILDLSGCSSLRSFPLVSSSIEWLYLENTAIKEVPCCIENFSRLTVQRLRNISPNILGWTRLSNLDLTECENLTEIPDLSKATNLNRLILNNCKSLVTVPSTIGNLQKLRRLEMQGCTGLEVLPVDVNLSSLKILDLSGCSSLRSFPLISWSIEWLYLNDTAIEEVPCCIENFSRLTILLMRGCKRLRNISPNIFGLTGLSNLDFMDCGGVFMALRDAIVMGTMEDHFSCGGNNGTYGEYLKFLKYCKLDVVARELILQLFVMPVALPGGEVPKYFMHRAYGDSLTVTLPRSSLSQEFLRFNACVVVDFPTKGNDWYRFSEISEWYPFLEVNVGFNGTQYWQSFFEDSGLLLHTTDYLFFCSFKIQPTDRPSKLAFNDVKFKFSSSKRIKECGVRLLNVSPYSDYSDGSSEKEYNQQSGEKCDVVVETERSKKRMRMTSGTSGEYITLPCGQIVADTGLTALNLELLLGQGEASPVSSFPCLVGEALCVDSMITEQQDAEIPILYNLFYHSDTIWRDWRNFGEPKS